GYDGWLVALIRLPKHDAHLVICKVGRLEDSDLVIRILLVPRIVVALLYPLSMRFAEPIALISERLRLLVELLPGVDDQHATTMALQPVAPQQPNVSKDAGVIEELVGEHDDCVKPVTLKNRTTDLAFTGAAISV